MAAAKKTAKKAAKTTSPTSKSGAASMKAWLKKAPEKADTSAMDVEEPTVDTQEPEQVQPPVKRPKRACARGPSKKPPPPDEEESESKMEGIQGLEDPEDNFSLVSRLDEIEAMATEPFSPAKLSKRLSVPFNAHTAALLAEYELGDDDLLKEVLGGSSSSKYTAPKTKAKASGKGTRSSYVHTTAAEEKKSVRATASQAPEYIDRLIEMHEREQQYSEKLANALAEIETGGGTDEYALQQIPRVRALRDITDDSSAVDTHYLLVYFAPQPQPPPSTSPEAVEYTTTTATKSEPNPPLRAVTLNDAKNQESFNRVFCLPNAIARLPLLLSLVRQRACPLHIAEWLVTLMSESPTLKVAQSAYNILLTMIEPPKSGWKPSVTKYGEVPVSPSALGLPFHWSYHMVAQMFNYFGAGQLAAIVAGATEEAKLMGRLLLPRTREGELDTKNLMEHLEMEANNMVDEEEAAAKAIADERLQQSLANVHFRVRNFELLVLHWTACCQAGYMQLTRDELIVMLVGVYRATVDPSCQSITCELQDLMIALYELLFNSVPTESIPLLVYNVCEALWMQIPQEQKNSFHPTYVRWVHLTPCSSKMFRSVRATMAFMFLKAQTQNPIEAPPEKSKKYKLGDMGHSLDHIVQFLKDTKLEKDASTAQLAMYSNWLLLIDIASACFDASSVVDIKKTLGQWDTALTSFHSQIKERRNDSTSSKLKDLATHALTKFRVINNSVAPKKGRGFFSKDKEES